MSDQKPPVSGTPLPPTESQVPARRALLRGALTAPVLMAIASKPVLAGQLCAPSGFASGNTSAVDNPTACNGRSPGYWKNHPNAWPFPVKPGHKFHNYFAGNYFGIMTMMDVLNTGGGGLQMLGRHCVAGLLNALDAPLGFVMTPDEVKNIWAQCLATAPNSVYVTGTGVVMTLADLDEFFNATYHQNMLAYYN